MSFHHVALATRDIEATHAFYTDVMGFDLVKVDAVLTEGGGWARHLFYDTHGQGLLAFWDIHDDEHVAAAFEPSISRGLGLPAWTNHLAFDAVDLDGLAEHKRRWLAAGHGVAEIDHGWCTSIYIEDPNGIMVEFCATTRPFTPADRDTAIRALAVTARPELPPPPDVIIHEPTKREAGAAARR
jgi:catechol 2,3-dioxygenase-like lactoylglutathione lyase family enzyme